MSLAKDVVYRVLVFDFVFVCIALLLDDIDTVLHDIFGVAEENLIA